MTIENSDGAVRLSSGRSLYFDLMRGIASQLVVVGHALNIALPAFFMVPGEDGTLAAREGLPYLQNFGVLVFFYISGYLITASVTRKSRDPAWGMADFLADRFARIFTPLLPMLVIVFALDNVILAGRATPYSDANAGLSDLVLNATMLAGNPALALLSRETGLTWISAPSFGTADQLWTVAIEWWIYVLFGLAYFTWFAKRSHGIYARLIGVGLLAIALSVVAGAIMTAHGLIVAWVIGMLAHVARGRCETLRSASLVAIAGAASFGAAALLLENAWDFYAWGPASLMGVAFFAALFAIDRLAWVADRPVVRGSVRYMSNISYSLYLVHLSLIIWIDALLPALAGSPLTVLAYLIAANAAGWLFYLAVERHYPQVRKRLQPLVDRLSALSQPPADPRRESRP